MKILVVRLSSLGDILHLFPAVSDLHNRYPDAEIHWLVEPAFAEAVSWHAAIDKVITVPLRAHKKTWWKLPLLLSKLRQRLQTENYDVVLDAQGLLKSAILSRLPGVPVYGFDANSARESIAAKLYQKTAHIKDGLHVIEKNRQLVGQLFDTEITQPADFGLNEFRSDQIKEELAGVLEEISDQPYIVLLHGTTWNSKYWPESSWIELIRMFSQQGWRCLIPWGNEVELQRACRLKAAGEKAMVLPKLSLTELMTILLHARAFVSVESGIGHLAAALDVPGVMLHGPTDPGYSGIQGKACQHIISGIYCSPCFKRDCPRIANKLEVPPCQQEIKPQQVYLQCEALLAPPESSA
ncbi:MAG: lipopolysaccharide heptosyltransferase I [Gallionella sp.]